MAYTAQTGGVSEFNALTSDAVQQLSGNTEQKTGSYPQQPSADYYHGLMNSTESQAESTVFTESSETHTASANDEWSYYQSLNAALVQNTALPKRPNEFMTGPTRGSYGMSDPVGHFPYLGGYEKPAPTHDQWALDKMAQMNSTGYDATYGANGRYNATLALQPDAWMLNHHRQAATQQPIQHPRIKNSTMHNRALLNQQQNKPKIDEPGVTHSFMCRHEGCGATFYVLNGLTAHMKEHSGKKPFMCPALSCSSAFARADELIRHHRKHSNERPFKCQHCPRAFSRSDHLSSHTRMHTGEKPYLCQYADCGKRFARPDERKRHHGIHKKRGSLLISEVQQQKEQQAAAAAAAAAQHQHQQSTGDVKQPQISTGAAQQQQKPAAADVKVEQSQDKFQYMQQQQQQQHMLQQPHQLYQHVQQTLY
eukprot:Clim_evm1s223 gene=Clim_evmTU1s223